MKHLLSLLAFLTACAPSSQTTISGPANVIDGDTIRVKGEKVRLWGIDAPENDTAAGKGSTSFLRSRIEGREVFCEERSRRDRWGRMVAKCTHQGEDVARIMVQAGYAKDWPKYSGGYYAD